MSDCRPIKVLYLLHNTQMSGGAISFIRMLSGVKAKGIEPVVVCNSGVDASFKEKMNLLGVPIIESRVPRETYPVIRFFRNYISYPWRLLQLFANIYLGDKQLKRIIRQVRPDIVHSNYGVIHQGYRVAKELGIPHVWHVREYQDVGLNLHIFPTKRSFIKALGSGSYVVTISKDLLNYFSQGDNPRAQFIYNGIFSNKEIAEAKEKYSDVKQPMFLCASRINAQKRHKDVIEAFAQFLPRHKEWKLEILGTADEESYQAELYEQCKKLGISDSVIWHGFKSDVRPYICRAKALIVASYDEGFGRMTAEASMLGTIPIGRNSAGTSEIINNSGGLLFEDVESLSQRMGEVAALSKEEYTKITNNIQQRSCMLYTNESNVEQIVKLYHSILEHRL